MKMTINEKWPVNYKGKEWFWKDVHPIYRNYYTVPESKMDDASAYVGDGTWIYPDGTTKHDENR